MPSWIFPAAGAGRLGRQAVLLASPARAFGVLTLAEHPHLGLDDVIDARSSDPLSTGQAARPLVDGRGGRWANTRCLRASPLRTGGTVMSTDESRPMTPDQEYDVHADPRNQEPQGPARRRKRQ